MEYPTIDVVKTGERIRELRITHHFTVAQVSEYMGLCSEQAVYKWQRGDSLPTVDNMYALSRLFDTTIDDIICGDRDNESVHREKEEQAEAKASACCFFVKIIRR
ncbi:MAG: helix-turn-helix domain-containing protein [Eubacterium sp.]|nr:helix-turn-helix domain-containing protein [Eubacterium sp.]